MNLRDRLLLMSSGVRVSFAITITPDYFRTVGAAVISGRDFNDFDRASTPPVALVNELFRTRTLAGGQPVGEASSSFRLLRPECRRLANGSRRHIEYCSGRLVGDELWLR